MIVVDSFIHFDYTTLDILIESTQQLELENPGRAGFYSQL